MHVVALNSARSTYRRLKNQAVPTDFEGAHHHERPDPRTTSVIAGTRLDLLEAMETIERDHPQYVEPLMLRDVYGLPYDEIAHLVGAPLGTVKAQIHHGRKLARPLLPGRGVRSLRRGTATLAVTGLLAVGTLTGCSGSSDSSSSDDRRATRRATPRVRRRVRRRRPRLPRPTCRPPRPSSPTWPWPRAPRSRTRSTRPWGTPTSTRCSTTSTSHGPRPIGSSPVPRR